MNIKFKKSLIPLLACSLGFTPFLSIKAEDAPDVTWTKLLGLEDTMMIESFGAAYFDNSIYLHGSRYLEGLDYENFITKTTGDGLIEWTITEENIKSENGNIATGTDGSLYITGYVQESIDNEVFQGSHDVHITKYSSIGEREWTKLLVTSTSESGYGVATASDGSKLKFFYKM